MPTDRASSLRPFLRLLRVRRWVVLQAVVLVPLIAITLSSLQEPRYEATSSALISRTNLSNVLTGTQDPTANEFDFNRVVQTQAQLAQAPRVATRVIQREGLRESPESFLARTRVTTDPNTDIVGLTVSAGTAEQAIRLSGSFVREFIGYAGDLTTNALLASRSRLQRQLDDLDEDSALASEIKSQLRRIDNLTSVGNTSITLIKSARTAEQTQPQVVRNGIVGLFMGIVVGVGLAFLLEALDTRMRTSAEVGERLGVPVLARLPAPPKGLRKENRIVMLEDPTAPQAESFRLLRVNLSFTNIDGARGSILVTSALASEGKSTTAANLAVAMARGGDRVILADLDFRRPYVERFFRLPRSPGSTNVVLGQVSAEDALCDVPLTDWMPAADTMAAAGQDPVAASAATVGRLQVLPTGDLPPNVGELVGSQALAGLLRDLQDRCDVLIVDAPPMLHVGDAMALAPAVDGLLLIARLGVVRRPMLDQLAEMTGALPTPVLGVVVTDSGVEGTFGQYDYAYGSYGFAGTAAGGTT